METKRSYYFKGEELAKLIALVKGHESGSMSNDPPDWPWYYVGKKGQTIEHVEEEEINSVVGRYVGACVTGVSLPLDGAWLFYSDSGYRDNKNWILTDDDTLQHRREIEPGVFELVEMRPWNPDKGTYVVVWGEVDMKEYLNDEAKTAEMNDILASFGYEKGLESFNPFGSDSDTWGIVAECIFESGDGDETPFCGTEPEAEKFISRYVNPSARMHDA